MHTEAPNTHQCSNINYLALLGRSLGSPHTLNVYSLKYVHIYMDNVVVMEIVRYAVIIFTRVHDIYGLSIGVKNFS